MYNIYFVPLLRNPWGKGLLDMYVCVDGCMLHCAILSRACTDFGRYVAEDLSYTRQLMLRYKTFCCTRAGSWCNVKRSYKVFSPTSIDAWCYVTRTSLVLAQTVDVTLQDLLLYMRRHLMVSERISSCTCTGTWCYINRSSRVLAQTLEVNYRIFFCTCRLSQTLGATLKDLPSYLHKHLMICYRMLRVGLGVGDHAIGGG